MSSTSRFGYKDVVWSSKFVMGLVPFLLSHSSIAHRSYVYPCESALFGCDQDDVASSVPVVAVPEYNVSLSHISKLSDLPVVHHETCVNECVFGHAPVSGDPGATCMSRSIFLRNRDGVSLKDALSTVSGEDAACGNCTLDGGGRCWTVESVDSGGGTEELVRNMEVETGGPDDGADLRGPPRGEVAPRVPF